MESNVWEKTLGAEFPDIEEAKIQLEKDFEILATKGQGYGPSWKLGGPMLLATMLLVKAVRIYNIVGKLQFGEYKAFHESIKDSVKDLQNYLLFMKQMIKLLPEAEEHGTDG